MVMVMVMVMVMAMVMVMVMVTIRLVTELGKLVFALGFGPDSGSCKNTHWLSNCGREQVSVNTMSGMRGRTAGPE